MFTGVRGLQVKAVADIHTRVAGMVTDSMKQLMQQAVTGNFRMTTGKRTEEQFAGRKHYE